MTAPVRLVSTVLHASIVLGAFIVVVLPGKLGFFAIWMMLARHNRVMLMLYAIPALLMEVIRVHARLGIRESTVQRTLMNASKVCTF